MIFHIKSESRGRIRIQAAQSRMTLTQADLLAAYLSELPGVTEAVVHDRTCCAIIRYTCTRQALLDALSNFSYDSAASVPVSTRKLQREYGEKLVTMILFHYARRLFLPAPFRMIGTMIRAFPYFRSGLRCIWKRQTQVEILDALSIVCGMLLGDYSTSGSVMFLLRIGDLLEEWTRKKSVNDLARSMALNVDRVWRRLPSGEEVLLPISSVAQGDEIIVRAGTVIPLDCRVLEGDLMVNQASMTGESLPVAKRPGTTVYAGTVVEEGSSVLSVLRDPGSSRYDRIVAMIEENEAMKSAAEVRSAALADHLVPWCLGGGILTYALTRNLTRAASVLMVDFSCALKLTMPIAVLSAMREAGSSHITVKGGKNLEAVSNAATLIFDKTGTLTCACPQVVDVVPFGNFDGDEMLRIAACLEEHFPHSIANAVVQAAKDRGLDHEEMHSSVEYIVAHGIASTIGEDRVVIGSWHFVFEDEGCVIAPEDRERFSAIPAMYTQLFLSVGGVLAAVICISDPLREEAADVVSALHESGIRKIVMLTGDSDRTARSIAARVGVDDYRAEVLPEDKARYVEAEKAAGNIVIMVGDGINDAPALSAADVGIAISDGAPIAREVADICIGANDLYALLRLRRLSTALMQRLNRNYHFIMRFNGTLIGLGALGIMAPATNALLHNASTIGLTLSSMTNLQTGGPAHEMA